MGSRRTALGLPHVCQNFGFFGLGRKALRHVHDAVHVLTQPSLRRAGIVHFETS